MKDSPVNSSGSAVVWLVIGGVVLAAIVVAFLVWGKVFLLTTGLDSTQVNSYTRAIDSANQIKQKIESQQPQYPENKW